MADRLLMWPLTPGVALAALALAGCAGAVDSPPRAPSPTTGTALMVAVTDGDHASTFTVTCDPAGGTHPHPQSACEFLDLARRWGHDPFAPVPSDQACAEVYGGPLTARVTGTWLGRPVDATFSQTDACQSGRWDNAVALLAVQERVPPSGSPTASR